MEENSRKRLLQLLGITIPIIQAPMAGADSAALAIAVSRAGGLGSLACAMLTPEQVREEYYSTQTEGEIPINLNFFCHQQAKKTETQQEKWLKRLVPYYSEYNIDPKTVKPAPERVPFNDDYCRIIEEIKPAVVSFHFGLPAQDLVKCVKATGAIVLSSATTVEEGFYLENNGCDIIIAQGKEAGGHRGMFLTTDLSTQLKTSDLISLLHKKLSVPIVAAGGIADAEDINKAFSLGASAVQLGTAFLFCKEARVAPLHREALSEEHETALTNIFTGRPARAIVNRFVREVGPISTDAPDFPYASDFVVPLRKASEAAGNIELMQLWSGEKRKAHELGAYELIMHLKSGIN